MKWRNVKKKRAGEALFWLGIKRDIEEMIHVTHVSNITRKKTKEPELGSTPSYLNIAKDGNILTIFHLDGMSHEGIFHEKILRFT